MAGISWGLLDLERLADVFWPKVDRSGGRAACWPWTDKPRPTGPGYGRIGFGGKTLYAHRAAWVLTHGPIPDETPFVLHACDNPPCCNAEHRDHLFLGTQADNNADMAAKGRATIGERNAAAKLTAEQVVEIHALLAEGLTQAEVARRYGVTTPTVNRIWLGKNWRHLSVAGAAS